MLKAKYEVTIGNEYQVPYDFYFIKDRYTKWFDTLKQAKKYASSIKRELKDYFKTRDDYQNNIIIIEVNKYLYDPEEPDEDFRGLWYSLNLLGKY